MSNLYKIGTKGLTASDNNHLVWDADVRRLYIDKDTPVDVVSADTIKESLGISSDGSATMYLNEQGNFVEAGGGSSYIFDSPLEAYTSTDGDHVKLLYNTDEFRQYNKSLKLAVNTSKGGTNVAYVGVDYVKERMGFSDGSWYRLWASGWLEQGGKILSTAASMVTVSLLMEYSDTNYNLQYTTSRNSLSNTGSAQIRYTAVGSITTTSFAVYAIVSTDQGHSWYACGWSA